MAAFLFLCPYTGYRMQGWVADDGSSENDGETYEAISCLACGQVHLVNPGAHQGREKAERSGAESRCPGAVARMVRMSGVSFDPDVIALITVAYRAVLAELRLYDEEDPATLMVAKHIIDFTAWGERDPERLKAATLAALTR
jgi:hypothetical protein